MELEPDSLERLVPDELEAGNATGRDTLRLHVDRYAFAARRLPAGRALDIACGVGYGARVLCDESAARVSVLGVDVSPAAIDYARRHYGGQGVEFQVADATRFEERDGEWKIAARRVVRVPSGSSGWRRRPTSPGAWPPKS